MISIFIYKSIKNPISFCSHRTNTTYWRTLSTKGWADEMVGIREMISKFAHIPEDDITGNFDTFFNEQYL